MQDGGTHLEDSPCPMSAERWAPTILCNYVKKVLSLSLAVGSKSPHFYGSCPARSLHRQTQIEATAAMALLVSALALGGQKQPKNLSIARARPKCIAFSQFTVAWGKKVGSASFPLRCGLVHASCSLVCCCWTALGSMFHLTAIGPRRKRRESTIRRISALRNRSQIEFTGRLARAQPRLKSPFRQCSATLHPPHQLHTLINATTREAPLRESWRLRGTVTPVRNQLVIGRP
jgi:hypothetical protein